MAGVVIPMLTQSALGQVRWSRWAPGLTAGLQNANASFRAFRLSQESTTVFADCPLVYNRRLGCHIIAKATVMEQGLECLHTR